MADSKAMTHTTKSKLAYLFLFLGLLFSCEEKTKKKESSPPTVSSEGIVPLTKTWEIAVPNQEVPEGIAGLSAKQCGQCHQKHYEEWQYSTHSRAWTDLQFQAELKKDTSPIMCINCHIPLQNQQAFFVGGYIDGDIYKPLKIPNPKFDKKLQQEGINCAGCHVRNNAVIGPTGTSKAPHKTIKDPDHLSEKLCIGCHNAVATITPTLACTFQTGDEWKAGPYYKKKNCISCHMEEVRREIVTGYGERKSHFHHFPGSGIPKRLGAKTKMLNGFTFTPSPLRAIFKRKEDVEFTFTLKNENAGHKVPTGDPERFFIISFTLRNDAKEMIKQEKHRIGEIWEWHPIAKQISDNNVLPGEERRFTFLNTLDKKGKYSLHVSVEKHRLSDKAADYNKLGKAYPRFREVYAKTFTFDVK